MIKKIALFVFILVSVIDIVGIVFKEPSLIFLFKPFILLSLLFLYSSSVLIRNKWYVMALIFSFFGDVFLLYPGELFFMMGLVSFLLAHFIYIKIVVGRINKTSFTKIITSIIPFFIVFSLLILSLKDSLNEMLLPVIIYGLTISIFGVVSLIDFQNTKSKKSLLMLIGAIVFMISDSVLAINKFYNSTHLFEVVIMVTYILAQYLIYRSMILKTEES
ncbi:lysoplasmalogenase [Lutibacter flavus]|uniref:Uncharacterized membrane protein YhhN n=1 Tax=Lutibacter flavus TaxID=691689 RepID=A0A238V913_9FLAO|nr:lysoplasmalogenase [Lutibacter flavus]SNR30537.1 Uncharacterized membrane protein YhhN [Lutibacter flavus]